MSVNLLLITHDSIGKSLLESITNMLGKCPLPVQLLSIKTDTNPETYLNQALELCQQIEKSDDVLILTDIYGSTPCNIALRLIENKTTRGLITGLNLPMLVRIMNYPNLPIDKLKEKAISGAQQAIFNVDPNVGESTLSRQIT